MIKNTIQKVMIVIILFTFISPLICGLYVQAAESWNISGEGSNVRATLDGNTLTISGTGAMKDFNSSYPLIPAPWYDYLDRINTVIINDGITHIGTDSFMDCTNLTNVTIPNSVTAIGNAAFGGCTSLTSISIPEGVTSIKGNTFDGCTSLTNVLIPESVISIGFCAFYDSGLTDVTIPNGVMSIGASAFAGTRLTTVSIPESVTIIEDEAFEDCGRLTNIDVNTNNQKYSSENGILFNKDKTELIKYPEGKTEHTYSIPESVINIKSYAFHYCKSLTSVFIPKSVTNIEIASFDSCNDLTIKCYENSYAETYAKDKKKEYKILPESINLGKSNVNLDLYGTKEENLQTILLPNNPKLDTELVWTSSNTSIATVDQNGMVTALSKGECDITATTVNGLVSTCKVTVINSAPEGISFNKETLSFDLYGTKEETLQVSITPDEVTVNKNVTWSSSNTDIATVDQNGKVTAISKGECNITATTVNGIVVTCKVTVINSAPETIALNKQTLSFDLYGTKEETLQASITPDEPSVNKSVIWNSNNRSIATVDQNGKVTAISKGECNITATTVNGIVATCRVTVINSAPETIALNKQTLSFDLYGTKEETLQASITPDEVTVNKNVTWHTSDATIATVDQNGRVTALSKGTCDITATTVNGKVSTCRVTVINSAPEGITLNKESLELDLNEIKEETLQVSITPDEPSVNKNVTWHTINPSIATVDQNGKVIALKKGTCDITATTVNGKVATCKVTVINSSKINIDIDDDGKPDINIDLDGDGKPDINIDTDGDGKPDINIDTNGDGKPDINIDLDGDGKPDINIDTDGDGKPDINIDLDGDGKPDINIDTDGDGKPDINIDTDGDGKPDINIDLDGDGKPDINIDLDGDGKPDLNGNQSIVQDNKDKGSNNKGNILANQGKSLSNKTLPKTGYQIIPVILSIGIIALTGVSIFCYKKSKYN